MLNTIGPDEFYDWTLSDKEWRYLQVRFKGHQPYIRSHKMYLLENTRRVRKIVRKYRSSVNSIH